jgi:hypothetical protein
MSSILAYCVLSLCNPTIYRIVHQSGGFIFAAADLFVPFGKGGDDIAGIQR